MSLDSSLDSLNLKEGDRIVCTYSSEPSFYRKGDILEVVGKDRLGLRLVNLTQDQDHPEHDSFNGSLGKFEKLNVQEYEDKWELNDGTVEIPEDADTLTKDGSVVAFRRVKRQPLRRGDRVKGKNINGRVFFDGLVLYDEEPVTSAVIIVHAFSLGTMTCDCKDLQKI